ncbi:RNA ligase family protein [bacterium]|nr:RNA ligase family protein [bacterium]
MKNYIEIQKVREHDIVVDENLTLKSNVHGFLEGDIISITEKIDGAQSHIYYDGETDKLRCFSSKNELSSANTLRGFYEYASMMPKEPFMKYPDYEFFGEWLVPHTVMYDEDRYNKWYLFSVYNRETGRWMPQSFVKGFAKKYQIDYPHELYYGPFLGWDHVYSFCNSPHYGRTQEGIVIKNQTALEACRGPHILKYVNPEFKEIQISNHIKKQEDPNKLKEKAEADKYISMIVTEARVKKIFYKLIDDGILPRDMVMSDMQTVAKVLPKAVYEDCIKEEPDIVKVAGHYGSKSVNRFTMQIVKSLLSVE